MESSIYLAADHGTSNVCNAGGLLRLFALLYPFGCCVLVNLISFIASAKSEVIALTHIKEMLNWNKEVFQSLTLFEYKHTMCLSCPFSIGKQISSGCFV